MKRNLLYLLTVPAILSACQTDGSRDTIAQLRNVNIDIREETIHGGLQKAMEGYQRFLEDTPESALTPEAMRRLADLKIEREYGILDGPAAPASLSAAPSPSAPAGPQGSRGETVSPVPERVAEGRVTATAELAAPERAPSPKIAAVRPSAAPQPVQGESQTDFEKRAARNSRLPAGEGQANVLPDTAADELERGGAREAIAVYRKLLDKYPLYQGNDQVLYQMSRAYDELGQTEDAMAVMDRLVRDFPGSRYLDEVWFRRAEYYFTRRQYLSAENAYKSIVARGVGSSYYELALYKLGWTFYKQELYDDALPRFIALLDHKVATGYDFAQTDDDLTRKRVDDTFRVVSLSFSYLQGPESVMEYFDKNGKRSYEDRVYSNLGEFYFEKRRYSDAAAAYNAFVKRNQFHRVAPQFQMRVIDINVAGGFPSIVIDAKKEFARNYGLKAEYWKHFEPGARPEVLGFLKNNLTDLAQHYHALYQNPEHGKEKVANFREALHWYEEFLFSFPKDAQAPAINYQLADLLLENKSFARAAVEYEKTAYHYPRYEKSSAAGYAAVYAYREDLRTTAPEGKEKVKRETVRSSLKFAETFPEHEKAAIVLGAAADDLFEMKEYGESLAAGRKLINQFPGADRDVLTSAWIVVGHSSYELKQFAEAEPAYAKVLALLPAEDKNRPGFVDNLAASIYHQGEQANTLKDYRAAADHFLRVGRLAPTSKIRANAEYDAAVALIQLKEWQTAATVLSGFRELFPGHELQPEATKKIAHVYQQSGRISLAAAEYERVESESKDEEVRRGALMLAADLYQQSGDKRRALAVFRRFAGSFPQPVEENLEVRNKITEILKAENDRKGYLDELQEIVAIDAAAGSGRTPRTRYLAGNAALVLAERTYERFAEVRLVQPFEANLRKKKELMKASTQVFNKLTEYEVGDVTAAATFYLGETYAHFSKALTESERPAGLNAKDLQDYELAIEEQAYPFEEKAIKIHEKNLELISLGIYNAWIDKSLERLAKFVPARYDKPEIASELVTSLETYTFEIERPLAPVGAVETVGTVETGEPVGTVDAVESAVPAPVPAEEPTEVVPEVEAPIKQAAVATKRAKGKKHAKTARR